MGKLGTWAKQNSTNLVLQDGESVEVVYLGADIGKNPFKPTEEIIFYKMGVIVEGKKMVKIFKSASPSAATFFDDVPEKTMVRIKRSGTGSNTKYEFTRLGAVGAPEKAEEVSSLAQAEEDGDFPFVP